MNGLCLTPGRRQTISVFPNAYRVWVPAGSFTMGSAKSEPGHHPYEAPQHRVSLRHGFWMMQTEVTQGQYKALMGHNPAFGKRCGTRCPVEKVSWHDALLFANTLSRKLKLPTCFDCKRGECHLNPRYLSRGMRLHHCLGWRLPTEAEWEYATRAQTSTPFYTGRCLSSSQANFDANHPLLHCPKGRAYKTSIPGGQLSSNPWGLYDMLGNVQEWCWNWHVRYSANASVEPFGPPNGLLRTTRGGSFVSHGQQTRAASRNASPPHQRNRYTGFRLVRNVAHPPPFRRKKK